MLRRSCILVLVVLALTPLSFAHGGIIVVGGGVADWGVTLNGTQNFVYGDSTFGQWNGSFAWVNPQTGAQVRLDYWRPSRLLDRCAELTDGAAAYVLGDRWHNKW